MSEKGKPQGPVLIDAEDQHLVMGRSWHRSSKGYVRRGRKADGTECRLHRLIAGAEDGQMVDHINGDILDNRRCNLRICTNGQNQQNQRLRPENPNGFKGVHCRSDVVSLRKYRAQIYVGDRKVNLGHFATAEEAAAAYDRAALEHFGEFARINFPQSQERAA
jgi:hypothetical protein